MLVIPHIEMLKEHDGKMTNSHGSGEHDVGENELVVLAHGHQPLDKAVHVVFLFEAPAQVDIAVLKKKYVYLLISKLAITEEEISLLRPVYDSIETNEQHKIVSIPTWEEWNEQLRKKYEVLKSKMPWYVVQNFGNIAGYKEEWHFKKKPMAVVLNHQGKVQHSNAFHLIQAYGMKAFLFTMQRSIHHNIADWSKEGESKKYKFYYGGKDKEWIQQFEKHATALVNDPIIKKENISIKLRCMETPIISSYRRFKMGPKVARRMHCYKNETGWAILSNNDSVVICGHGTTILKTVTEFEKWKKDVNEKGFKSSIEEYHKR